jgi:hypothetical protein
MSSSRRLLTYSPQIQALAVRQFSAAIVGTP